MPPPLGMSPNGDLQQQAVQGQHLPHPIPPPGSLSNPGTPGSSTLWNSLLSTATTQQQQQQQQQQYTQYMMRKGSNNLIPTTGLASNESNVRMGISGSGGTAGGGGGGGIGSGALGLTPGGGLGHFGFSGLNGVPGFTTPGGGLLLNGPITPGLSSLLGIAPTTGTSTNMTNANGTNSATSGGLTAGSNMLPPVNNSGNIAGGNATVSAVGGSAGATTTGVPTTSPNTETKIKEGQFVPSNDVQSVEQRQQANPQYVDVFADDANKQTVAASGVKETGRKRKNSTKTETESPSKKPKGTRGRKPGNKAAKSKKESKKDEMKAKEAAADEDDEKRRSFLERNRVAASKCRQRKKQLLQKMEDELAFYLAGYRELLAQVANLRNQVINLKGIVVGHKDCVMFQQSVGGINVLNDIIQQANFATQVSAGAQENITSMPTTIPTTLNNNTIQQPQPQQTQSSIIQQPAVPLVQVTAQKVGTSASAPPVQDHSVPTSLSATPELYAAAAAAAAAQNQNVLSAPSGGANIVAHHSMTDLPSAAVGAAPGVGEAMLMSNGASNDLRAISSMTNLTGMAAGQQRQF